MVNSFRAVPLITPGNDYSDLLAGVQGARAGLAFSCPER